jgi:hypothetical protein
MVSLDVVREKDSYICHCPLNIPRAQWEDIGDTALLQIKSHSQGSGTAARLLSWLEGYLLVFWGERQLHAKLLYDLSCRDPWA